MLFSDRKTVKSRICFYRNQVAYSVKNMAEYAAFVVWENNACYIELHRKMDRVREKRRAVLQWI